MAYWKILGSVFGPTPTEGLLNEFGTSVSISADGTTMAIGAPGVNETSVYQYSDTTGNWEWTQLGSTIVGQVSSGTSVSLSADGTTLAIGTPTATDSNEYDTGEVNVYQYSDTNSTWTQIGSTIINTNADSSESGWNFGISVSLSADGTTLAIGADGTNTPTFYGLACVYQYSDTNGNLEWTQLGSVITITNSSETDYAFGKSVSLSADGTMLAIGAPQYSSTDNSYNGHVSVYQYSETNGNLEWTQLGSTIVGTTQTDISLFGVSVSLSADRTTLAIGAPGANEASVYQYSDTTGNLEWTQLGSTIVGQVSSGASVSLSADGRRLAIGAPGTNEASVYQYSDTTGNLEWKQLGSAIVGQLSSGTSVSLSADGRRIVIGGPDYNGYQGVASVYSFIPTPPTSPAPTPSPVPRGSDVPLYNYTYGAIYNRQGSRIKKFTNRL